MPTRRKKKTGETTSQEPASPFEGSTAYIEEDEQALREAAGLESDEDDEALFDSLEPQSEEFLDRAGPSWNGKYIEAAGEITGWGKAADVFDEIISVRTVFPDFNRATHVGGLPVRRIHTVHGPTHGGKTAFVLGLAKSFADVGFLTGYVDAEFSLGKEFGEEIVRDLKAKPNFLAVRPENYEETMRDVDLFLKKAAAVKKVHPEAKALLIVDSINKLVPKRELEKILKAGAIDDKGAKELAKAHHARYRAALNQAWLDHLTPIVSRSDTALVLIAQERDEQDTTDFFKQEFKVKGGAALLFDASLVIRVMKSSPVFINPSKDKKNENICGFGHRVRIWKSKVSHMEGRFTDCIFHLSNGKFAPRGLDFARDALTVGIKFGVVQQSGAWYSYRGRRSQGFNSMIMRFVGRPALLHDLLGDVNLEMDREAGRL